MVENKSEITCIICPWGCQVKLKVKGGRIESVEGNRCPRGIGYAKQEFYNPQRVLTATVKVKSSRLPLLPVRTDKPIPKQILRECMRYLASIQIEAPVKLGEVIVPNILNTGANVISTRSLDSNGW